MTFSPPSAPIALGRPIPDSPHAVSVSLPRWQDVVGYEERDPAVLTQLTSGYPRFVLHPRVRELIAQLAAPQPALPFPSPRIAAEAAAYVRRVTGQPTDLLAAGPVTAVTTAPAGEAALRGFWQHTGMIVSSRQAEACLDRRPPAADGEEVRRSLRRQLAALYDCAETDVLLTPTGMAAQYAALRTVMAWRPHTGTVQLGFPYVDTLKLQQRLGCGAVLLHDLERLHTDLEARLRQGPVAACFSEIPGNPLLGCADLSRLMPRLRQARVPLVADDVVATPHNIDLSPHADLIATSLTKYLVGTGDAMGGALVCNPRSPLYAELAPLARAHHEELLWIEDARVIEAQVRTFGARMERHNANGRFIAEKLRQHPAVERVWYPLWESASAYEAVRRPGRGWGGLITFLPRDAARQAAPLFDRLPVAKGPSLGTVFTLACPFTLLAHYPELEWAEACGVSRHLIRLSVGIEDPVSLWAQLATALAPETA